MLLGVLGYAEYDDARSIVKRLLDAVPSGSYLVIDDGVRLTESSEGGVRVANAADVMYRLRTFEQIAGFFEGLDWWNPMLSRRAVATRAWRQGPVPVPSRRQGPVPVPSRRQGPVPVPSRRPVGWGGNRSTGPCDPPPSSFKCSPTESALAILRTRHREPLIYTMVRDVMQSCATRDSNPEPAG
jgi:S-adenosyl methyltransferase